MKKKIISLVFVFLLLTGCSGNMKDGVALLEEGRYEEAIKSFEIDIKKEKRLEEAYRGVGIAYFELGEYEEAAEALKLALENEAEETATMFSMLGASYMELEEYDKALDAYERALSKEDITKEMKQEIEYNLIAVYEYMGNWDAAKTQLQKYAEAYPEDTRIDTEAEFLETR